MSNKKIWLSPPHMDGVELEYIRSAFETNWIAPLGPNVDAFEDSIKRYCNVNGAVVLSSGTAAIHLALIILGVKSGDEVIASTFTFSATVNPIIYQGATPILIDSEPNSWNMCPELLEETIKDRIKKGKLPKAIILVHLYGMPANVSEIIEIANKYGIPLVEDAAEALGSKFKGEPVGSFGRMSMISFNGNKIITTSSGGVLLSNDLPIIYQARYLSAQARDEAPHYQHSQIGYNYRMSNVLAGIGIGQLSVIEQRVAARRKINSFYLANLKIFDFVTFLEEPNSDYYSNHWLSVILIGKNKFGKNNNELRELLEAENIESRPVWKPMHLQPVFHRYPSYVNGVSETFFDKGLCLPSGSAMSLDDLDRILSIVKGYFARI